MCAQDQDRSHLEQGKQDRCGCQPNCGACGIVQWPRKPRLLYARRRKNRSRHDKSPGTKENPDRARSCWVGRQCADILLAKMVYAQPLVLGRFLAISTDYTRTRRKVDLVTACSERVKSWCPLRSIGPQRFVDEGGQWARLTRLAFLQSGCLASAGSGESVLPLR